MWIVRAQTVHYFIGQKENSRILMTVKYLWQRRSYSSALIGGRDVRSHTFCVSTCKSNQLEIRHNFSVQMSLLMAVEDFCQRDNLRVAPLHSIQPFLNSWSLFFAEQLKCQQKTRDNHTFKKASCCSNAVNHLCFDVHVTEENTDQRSLRSPIVVIQARTELVWMRWVIVGGVRHDDVNIDSIETRCFVGIVNE